MGSPAFFLMIVSPQLIFRTCVHATSRTEETHGEWAMKRCMRALSKGIAIALVCSLLGSSAAYATPVNPETIHRKIVERGVGNWVCVEQANGILLIGRVTNIDEQSFGMQLESYPEITTIHYADVVKLRNAGISGKSAALFAVAGIGGVVAIALIAHHEMNNFKNNEPTLPPMPGYPGLR